MNNKKINILEPITNKDIHADAGGKAILIGEHSVVYGYKAIALALPDIRLSMSIYVDTFSTTWENAWETRIKDQIYKTDKNIQQLLSKAFAKALELCHASLQLDEFKPQKIVIQSEIPLGGGMGGSAAISTCLVKIAAAIAKQKGLLANDLTHTQQILFANEVDCLFHSGKASGLDVTTVACDGLIEFIKDTGYQYIKNAKEFWLALVDSQERGETSAMVKKVYKFVDTYPEEGKQCLENLGKLAEKTTHLLKDGLISELGLVLDSSQIFLEKLGVSTPKIKEIIQVLKQQGALAAKLTGAGGGGLVLALFENKPNHLYSTFSEDVLYITKVPKYE